MQDFAKGDSVHVGNLSTYTISDDDDEAQNFVDSLKRFKDLFKSLTSNNKKVIVALTELAGANVHKASDLVNVLVQNDENVDGMLVVYVMDSITKVVGGQYVTLFSGSLVHLFKNTFEAADRNNKKKLFTLRWSWRDVFPAKELEALVEAVYKMDRNWPIADLKVNIELPTAVDQKDTDKDSKNKEVNNGDKLPVTSRSCFVDNVQKVESSKHKVDTEIDLSPEDEPVIDAESDSDGWIPSGKYFTIPQDIWQRIFKDNKFVKEAYTYYKGEIGEIFNQSWNCIFLITHKNAGQSRISLTGKCKHQNCRRFNLIWYGDNINDKVSVSPPFLVRYDKENTHHTGVLCRQVRGVTRDQLKDSLRHSLANSYNNNLLRNMDEDLYASGVSTVLSDDTTRKVRSEMLQANDLCKGDFQDFISLQEATKENPYIAKVVSPFAVYIHSKIQFKVLIEAHRRKKIGEEVVGRLDATGGVVNVDSETSKKTILYYPLILSVKGDCNDTNSTLCSVTESHNSNHGVPDISAWLNCFNEDFMKFNSTILPVFDRIISDFSYANFHGVLHTFQSMRIHEYLFICYKYGVNLTDFEQLRRLVKIQMCTTHLSKTFAQFVRTYFPSKSKASNATFEEKFLIECLSSLMICKSYNLIKEIFRQLCIITLTKFVTIEVSAAKEAVVTLTSYENLMTVPEEMLSNFKYNKLSQENSVLTDCNTVYDLNESILNLPIYESSLFYIDLLEIFNDVGTNANVDDENLQNNTLYNSHILPAFMKQFGGILPLWTGMTIPKGIERYDNQPAELQMRKVKQSMNEKQLQLGSGKLKATRFVKLVRDEVLANCKRYLLKVPRRGLNYGRIRKNKDKDDAKISKRIRKNIRDRIKQGSRSFGNGNKLKDSFSDDNVILKSSLKHQSVQQLNNAANSEINQRKTSQTTETSKSKDDRMQEENSEIERRESMSSRKKSDRTEKVLKALPRIKYGHIGISKSSKRVPKRLKSQTAVSSSIRRRRGETTSRKIKEKSKVNSDTVEVAHVTETEQPVEEKDSSRNSVPGQCNTTESDKIETTLEATESWSKKGSKKNKTKTYFDRTTMVQSISVPEKSTTPTESTNMFHKNGLFKNVRSYLKSGWSFVVAKRSSNLSSESFLLSAEDLQSLECGRISASCMNYIMNSIVPKRHINLTLFAPEIVAGNDPFTFSIHNKTCFIPYLDENEWVLYIINTSKSTLCYIASNMRAEVSLPSKLKIIRKFIDTYNASKRHNKLKDSSCWNVVTVATNDFEVSADSGINVVNYVYRLVKDVEPVPFNDDNYKNGLMCELVENSDDMAELCLKCGQVDDASSTSKISWSMCSSCKRWIHDTCFQLEGDTCPICISLYQDKILRPQNNF